jgi:hypothetical protein
MAKLEQGATTLHVDLDKCEKDDPCSYDHTCRIHKLRWFLRMIDVICPDEPSTGIGTEPQKKT